MAAFFAIFATMVYFIEHPNGFIKIGVANDVSKRLSQIQVSCPEKLKVILVIEGSFELEAQLHHQFLKFAHNGEWFRAEREIYDFVLGQAHNDLSWELGFSQDSGVLKHGLNIRTERLKQNLTIRELAEIVGVSKTSAKDAELRELHGVISLNSLRKFADGLGKNLEYRFVSKFTSDGE